MKERNPYKKRIQIIVDILGDLVKKADKIDRKHVVEIIRRTYERNKLSPLRGKALPPDIYDKEVASLYVVGKYGLALDEEYPELFDKVFYLEKSYENAIQKIIEGRIDEAREILKQVSPTGVIDSNTVARMLRTAFTRILLGFMGEEEFAKILVKTKEAIPEEERTVRNYVRFYIAFRVAEAIYRGELRNKMYKEAFKRALALRLGFPRVVPSDDYIAIIAKEVFSVNDNVLNKVLSLKREEKEDQEEPSQGHENEDIQ